MDPYPMTNEEFGGGNSLQQNLMLPVKGFRLLRRQGRANPLAGTDATAPGLAGKG